VSGRMPILSGNNERKTRLQSIGDGYDGIAVRNGQRAAGEEVVLQVNEDEAVHDRIYELRFTIYERLAGSVASVSTLRIAGQGHHRP
jgi:hypothetical protein